MRTLSTVFCLSALAWALPLEGAAAAATPSGEIDFNQDIRPILSENCFHCHGPDAEAREGDLRLDVEADTRKDLGGYAAVVPGDLEQSELYYRVSTDDGDDLMPPKKSKRFLTQREKDLLGKWIESGGEYDTHWAYKAPVRSNTGASLKATWGRSEIDAFVLRRLEKEGLAPSPEADRGALLRRLSLDLVGLPPSPEELKAFFEDPDETGAAYAKVVDRLLASPRFGEKWARSWLDLARYADSNGFQADQLRDSWAYRDWVIDALNADMPFDRFTIEQ
ncbi:MAG: DUF1549 domain-containing protein [Verrucomicrobiales bacterium]